MKNRIPMNRIEFMIGDLYDRDSAQDRSGFYLAKDKNKLSIDDIVAQAELLLNKYIN